MPSSFMIEGGFLVGESRFALGNRSLCSLENRRRCRLGNRSFCEHGTVGWDSEFSEFSEASVSVAGTVVGGMVVIWVGVFCILCFVEGEGNSNIWSDGGVVGKERGGRF